jgi:hypothetical protein
MDQSPHSKSNMPAALVAKPALLDVSRFCPNCGTEMGDSRCKLKCPNCEFFLSCSDFY